MKKCIECHREVPEDSNFCPYCGGKTAEEIVNLAEDVSNPSKKICNSCGKEVDSDSVFCPFCGSKDLITEAITRNKPVPNTVGIVCSNCKSYISADSDFCPVCHAKVDKVYETKSVPTTPVSNSESTKKNALMIPFVLVCILACFLGYLAYNNYQVNQELNTTVKNLSDTNVSLKTQLTTAQNNANKNQAKASGYETIKNSSSTASNTNFFVSNTVLKKPNKQRVVFYIGYNGRYTISWESDYGITTTAGNTSSGLVYMDVTYTGSGVKTITCTNSVNSQKITIYCIGD